MNPNQLEVLMILKQEIMIKKIDYNKKVIYSIIIVVMALALIISYFQSKKIDEINKSGFDLIAKFTYYKKYPKSKSYYFEYYYLNSKKVYEEVRAPNGFILNVGKFYRIKYLPKYPDLLVINFDKEVTDKEEILKAGFGNDQIARICSTVDNPMARICLVTASADLQSVPTK
jgi:hypothetical protein